MDMYYIDHRKLSVGIDVRKSMRLLAPHRLKRPLTESYRASLTAQKLW